ncbi:helix-turn-helix domain-containing protein, partial [Bacillus toyonensis]
MMINKAYKFRIYPN